ncbi:transporter [Pollutimonas subterranea]|uniref:Transporter n=1 Tax=Pollutimonas subterranea TaxID=2045210 RepID=A0A2N4U519_9BURK|nr:AEC family transporter [Pollutimonas subterranea]PLC50118.1 transporter [Pollutimonas subterranea]
MSVIINAVFPLFALILVGYISGRKRLLGAGAVDSLNKFVVWMALPALLFQAMAQITWEQVNQPGYVAASFLAIAFVFATSYALDRRRRGRLADASIEGLAASYSNSGFMGIPLCLMVFGPDSLPPVIIAILLTACALFAFSIVLIEVDLVGPGSVRVTTRKVAMSLLRNPLVAAPVLGAIVAALQIPLPYAVLQFTGLLGAAASPCALVTIGLFLAQGKLTLHLTPVWRIVALKLFLHPLIAFVLVRWVFDMPPLWASTAILLAALPVGTGPFMLAKLYEREPETASGAILISTVLSVATVSVMVALLGPGSTP